MDIVLRTIAIFFFLFGVMRVVGRRELGQLQPFDVLLLVVIGDLVAQGVTQTDSSVTGALVATGTFALLSAAISYLAFRFARLRPLLEGQPLVVVQHGEIVADALRRERLTRDDVLEEARQQGIASLEDVRWGILETSSRISFLRREGA